PARAQRRHDRLDRLFRVQVIPLVGRHPLPGGCILFEICEYCDAHATDAFLESDWRLETGDWRLETGDWRLEIREFAATLQSPNLLSLISQSPNLPLSHSLLFHSRPVDPRLA